MKSRIVKGVLEDELRRNNAVIKRYQRELGVLPKGCLFVRHIGKNQYVYINMRLKDKVVSIYKGKMSNKEIEDIKEKIKKRNEYKKIIKKISVENKEIKSILKR